MNDIIIGIILIPISIIGFYFYIRAENKRIKQLMIELHEIKEHINV